MKSRIKQVLKFFGRFCLFSVSFSVLLVIAFKWLPVAWTPLMFFREMGEAVPENTPIRHEWISAEQVPASLELAVVCTEDQRFLSHRGFDFESIQLAMEQAEDGGKSRGASTISQQTAKNVFCWPTSSWIRKGAETWFTILIETLWSKERILHVYLNSIEFGPGIYGCEAASHFFFKKSAGELTNAQSARLAVVLPNPLKYDAGNPGPYVKRHQAWALQQMANYGYDIESTRVNDTDDDSKPPKKKPKSR